MKANSYTRKKSASGANTASYVSPIAGRNHVTGKNYNRALLQRLILQQGPMSRLGLSRATKLSPAALTILTANLVEEGRLLEIGEPDEEIESGRVGRRSTLLDLNPDAALAVGVHIAPRAVQVGLVDIKGRVRAKVRLPAPGRDTTKTLEMIVEAIHSLLVQEREKVLGVGVGAMGLVQHEKGLNLNALSLQWQDVPISGFLLKRLSLPVWVDNNAHAMAVAEHLFGQVGLYRTDNLALVYGGAGIGSGLIIAGQPYRGAGGTAGEIGHVTVIPGGESCYCGGFGCLETVASEISLLRQANVLAVSGQAPFLAAHHPNITLDILAAAYHAGDSAVVNLINQAGTFLGVVLVGVIKLLNPETLILAGPLFDGRLPLFEQVVSMIAAVGGALGGTRNVLPSSLGEDVGILGAASLVLFDKVFTANS